MLLDVDGDIISMTRTPQAGADSNVATATIERHKSQIEKLHAEMITVSNYNNNIVIYINC